MIYGAEKYKGRNSAKTWACGLYLRLSREDGDKYESDSISSQKDILLDFVSKNGDLRVFDTYIDDGYSGTNFNRPRFKDMEEDLRAKKIDCIVVKDLSRFGRNSIEIGNYLTVLFPYLKTRFICINDNVDSFLDPESLDNLSTKFKNLINDEYCRDISLKVKSALTMKRECGQFIGSFASFGYKKAPEDNHRIIVDEDSAEIVRKIFSAFIGGESIRAIVRRLNYEKVVPPGLYKKLNNPNYNPNGVTDGSVWTQRTVKRILTNRMYVGDMVQNVMNTVNYRVQKCRAVDKENYIVVENTHEPIISRKDFGFVKGLLSRDTRESPKTQELNVLAGFIKCGDCRRGMIKKKINNGWKEYSYYICSTYKNKGKNLCSKHTIKSDKVENAVFEFIKFNIKLVLEIEPILELINGSPLRVNASNRLKTVLNAQETELIKTAKLKEELYPDYKAGLIDYSEYENIREKYASKICEIEDRIVAIKSKIEEIEKGISPENSFIKSFKEYHNITQLTREIVCALIENVYVYENDKIEIVMKFKDEYDAIIEYVNENNGLFREMTDRLDAVKKVVPTAI